MLLLKSIDVALPKTEKHLVKTSLPPDKPIFKVAAAVKPNPSENFSKIPLPQTEIEIPPEESFPEFELICFAIVATLTCIVHIIYIVSIILLMTS